MRFNISPLLIYFTQSSSYLLIPCPCLGPPPPDWKPLVCSLYPWVCFCFVTHIRFGFRFQWLSFRKHFRVHKSLPHLGVWFSQQSCKSAVWWQFWLFHIREPKPSEVPLWAHVPTAGKRLWNEARAAASCLLRPCPHYHQLSVAASSASMQAGATLHSKPSGVLSYKMPEIEWQKSALESDFPLSSSVSLRKLPFDPRFLLLLLSVLQRVLNQELNRY